MTDPCHLGNAVRPDKDVAQVSIGSMVPLLLKDRIQQADVWPCLLWIMQDEVAR